MYGIYANIGGRLMVNVTIDSIHGSYGIIWWIMVIWIDTSWGCSWSTVSLRSFLLGYNFYHCLSEVFSSCPGFLGRNVRCFSQKLHPLLRFARQGNATSACGESAAQEVPLAYRWNPGILDGIVTIPGEALSKWHTIWSFFWNCWWSIGWLFLKAKVTKKYQLFELRWSHES